MDECSLNTNICHSNAECNNTVGAFECHCLSGYIGNGFNCTGINMTVFVHLYFILSLLSWIMKVIVFGLNHYFLKTGKKLFGASLAD